MKFVISFLLLPFCTVWSYKSVSRNPYYNLEDRGYERLCSEEFKCVCPHNSEGKFVDCIQLNLEKLPNNLLFPVNVESINFQGNRIAIINVNTFYNGAGVSFLDLSFNRLNYISSTAFLGFEKLTHLYLSHNELQSIPVNMLQGLHNLRMLDLSFNKLQTFLSDIFEDTSELRELKLKFNPLMNLDDISFEHLPMLEKLELESTGLTILPSNLFKYTPNLKTLSLASNFFHEVPSRALQNAEQLQMLDISENLIVEVKPNDFRGLRNLATLFMNRQRGLITIREFSFGDLVNLHTLQCSYNPELMYIDSDAFRKNGSAFALRLQQLHLRDNALEYLPHDLLSWNDIPYLDLRENPWRCDCNLRWMADYHQQQNFQENIKCASPSYYENIPVSKLKADDFVCQKYYFTDSFPILLIFIASILIGVSSFISLVIYCVKKVNLRWRATRQSKYSLIVPKVERIDLEWDHSMDP
ncbi:leucine-rich repeat neuronal protein 3-like [Centruroides sculpturatus]|uniref:leucine-rich repeat neuronal protein 3-like n=1 Tax=Centruroides sculpturatus TaxID=218467 RepID=UPI000C6ED2BF|nr:leucine-rich repeat neuronal protein 3-like [Centruroides sculpturatus]